MYALRLTVYTASKAPSGTASGDPANFAGTPHDGYRLGLPWEGSWREVLNTDAVEYFGSGVGNLGDVEATGDSWHGQPASATLRVPPLGTVWLASDGPVLG